MELEKTQTLETQCRDLEAQCARYVRELESANRRLNREVQEHHLARQNLVRSEGCFRSLFQQAPLGAVILDPGGTVNLANSAVCRMLDYSEEELLGKAFDDFLDPPEAAEILAGVNDLIGGRKPDYSREARLLTKAGDLRWAVLNFAKVEDEDENPMLIIALVEDITDRKRARDELERVVEERTSEIRLLKDRLQAENQFLRQELNEHHRYGEIIGESHAIQTVISQIELVAPTDASVLIQGESGTGKELIAREIHKHSKRSDRPLIKVNCATIPKDLYESEFFGHVKGAFTGATGDRMGRFETADGGTLFLDEVGEIPIDLQSKLLRVLQEGEFERVGHGKTYRVDVRVIAATNKDLKKEMENRRFRDDLFYRLNVFPIWIAPLRSRKGDIPLLASHFVETLSKKMNLTRPRLSRANMADLESYEWPGNVRELENAVERAIILSHSGKLHFTHTAGNNPMVDTGRAVKDVQMPGSDESIHILTTADFRRLERQNTLNALNRSRWKISGKNSASELLDVKPTTLTERMKRWHIRKPA